MANQNVQGPIQLAGRGAIYRSSNNYSPGEYRSATNVDLDRNGQLKNRPPVQGYVTRDATVLATERLNFLVGNYNAEAIVSTFNGDICRTRSGTVEYANCTSVSQLPTFRTNAAAIHPLGTGATNITATVVGFTFYNSIAHILVVCSFRPSGSNDLVTFLTVMYATILPSGTNWPIGLNNYQRTNSQVIASRTFIGFFNTGPATYYLTFEAYPKPFVSDWVVFRDRLWIAVDDTLYFSEVGNLVNFVAPDGGFTKFPHNNPVSLSAVGETIYVVSDSKIYAVSYGTDFNTDGEVTLISDVVGGEDSTVYGDSVYVVNAKSLFRIDGHNVSKVMDLEVNLPLQRFERLSYFGSAFTNGSSPTFKLTSFDDSLFIIPRQFIPSPHADARSPFDVRYAPYVPYDLGFGVIDSDPSCIKINMNNGFVSYYSFGNNGIAYDSLFIPNNDSLNQSRIFFIGKGPLDKLFSIGSYPSIVIDNTNIDDPVYGTDIFNIDSYGMASEPGNLDFLEYEIPAFCIWITNISPDNLRNTVKKFRTMEIEGTPPKFPVDNGAGWDVVNIGRIMIAAGNHTAAEPYVVNTPWVPTTQEFASYDVDQGVQRVGVNQRMDRFSLIIVSQLGDDPDTLGFPIQYHMFSKNDQYLIEETVWSIADIRTRWTFTARGRTGVSPDPL